MNHTGRLFLIAGNSGSGKDALLTEVLARWPASVKPIRIPQRYITRPAHDSEHSISVTAREFWDLKRKNKFWLTWHVYNTDYGIPTIVLDWLRRSTGCCGQRQQRGNPPSGESYRILRSFSFQCLWKLPCSACDPAVGKLKTSSLFSGVCIMQKRIKL